MAVVRWLVGRSVGCCCSYFLLLLLGGWVVVILWLLVLVFFFDVGGLQDSQRLAAEFVAEYASHFGPFMNLSFSGTMDSSMVN